ncbi:DUF6973 domain-containing protein [Paramaledivibacter caminithermalis]|jgi:hypothetical protein|uniref:DUF6973 domain-containing protein n=1 Tax=Paramaledivibacter caminithermalis (strain DSM 15212 / CIP 107654 / DViRD3) TaxID=1121301 RepID=A0A1M6P3F4_PARC5|nr:hypothetical protein [Paramaledivibacter caminithermalis]SHK02412.1 hypothetical protein SAMN02745912_01993 [Paramaledivibacter caminithermalis DSM 15212]
MIKKFIKKIISLMLVVCLVLTANIVSFAQMKNKDMEFNNYAKFYLNLVEEYKVKNPNASLDDINDMLRKAMKKYDKNFAANRIRIQSIDYSDYLPTDKVALSDPEKEVFNSNPYYGLQALLAAQTAIDMSERRYSYGLHNGNGDAFRHSLWNCLMSSYTTVSYAKKFADAHEEGVPNEGLESYMDIYNNKKGRDVYVDNKSRIDRAPTYARTGLIIDLIQEAVDGGNMRRFAGDNFKGTYLVKTDTLGKK